MLEFVIGNKNAEMIQVHRRDAAGFEALSGRCTRRASTTSRCAC
jgi:hypothetical protein